MHRDPEWDREVERVRRRKRLVGCAIVAVLVLFVVAFLFLIGSRFPYD